MSEIRLIVFVTEEVCRRTHHPATDFTGPLTTVVGHVDTDQTPAFDPTMGEPALEFEFDQTVNW